MIAFCGGKGMCAYARAKSIVLMKRPYAFPCCFLSILDICRFGFLVLVILFFCVRCCSLSLWLPLSRFLSPLLLLPFVLFLRVVAVVAVVVVLVVAGSVGDFDIRISRRKTTYDNPTLYLLLPSLSEDWLGQRRTSVGIVQNPQTENHL